MSAIPEMNLAGKPVSAMPAEFYLLVAQRLNNASGIDGVSVGVNEAGGLLVRLGDDQYQMRYIWEAEPLFGTDGKLSGLAFRRRRALCALPDEADLIIDVAECQPGTTP